MGFRHSTGESIPIITERQVKSKGINTIFTGHCPVKKDGICRPFLFMEPGPAQAL